MLITREAVLWNLIAKNRYLNLPQLYRSTKVSLCLAVIEME